MMNLLAKQHVSPPPLTRTQIVTEANDRRLATLTWVQRSLPLSVERLVMEGSVQRCTLSSFTEWRSIADLGHAREQSSQRSDLQPDTLRSLGRALVQPNSGATAILTGGVSLRRALFTTPGLNLRTRMQA